MVRTMIKEDREFGRKPQKQLTNLHSAFQGTSPTQNCMCHLVMGVHGEGVSTIIQGFVAQQSSQDCICSVTEEA